ncbi:MULTISPECIES: MarR family winged helix-turn-helix transcriptional regulator [unclassified Ruegeria]|uniref:MarR family winged helix-turn-helix transcriptional regulator n=1 Tax=unclassified Ruegeria TaxID=2625375 RepID=UPI0014878BD1|nr:MULTISPECIES: MarR family transcriptional regulator [unclassified Ruegeria]
MKAKSKTIPEPISKTRLRLWLRLLKLSAGIEAELRRRLRDGHDTTLPRFDVLAALSRHPDGLKMSDLSGYLKVSNGNVTGIVDRLTEEGLALRVAIPGDRRAQLARLTPKGKQAFDTLAEHHEAWVDELLGGLSLDEAETLSRLLEKARTEDDAS